MSQSNITIVDTSNGGDNNSSPPSPTIRRRKVAFADEDRDGSHQHGDQEPERSESMKYEEKQSVFGLRPWSAKIRYVFNFKNKYQLIGWLDVSKLLLPKLNSLLYNSINSCSSKSSILNVFGF